MTLSTHVLDISLGKPATGLDVALFRIDGEHREAVASATTDDGGRVASPFGGELAPGFYELVFHAGNYFARHGVTSFYTEIPVRFRTSDANPRYHVPLLLSPWGYSTYRGS